MNERTRRRTLGVASTLVLLTAFAVGAQTLQSQQHADHAQDANHAEHANCPMHEKSSHHEGVDARGDEVMGFEHAKTAHHFRLLPDGGAIEVAVNDPADTASRDMIRQHLGHVAHAFADGDFSMPMAIHDRVPPGAEAMQRLVAKISYTYEQTDLGGRVRIRTSDPAALEAVHAFLRFQIEDHRTGDPLEVPEER